jgi:hypothetical protein
MSNAHLRLSTPSSLTQLGALVRARAPFEEWKRAAASLGFEDVMDLEACLRTAPSTDKHLRAMALARGGEPEAAVLHVAAHRLLLAALYREAAAQAPGEAAWFIARAEECEADPYAITV